MKHYREELWFEIPARRGFVNITPEISTALQESGIQEGLCLVNAMHITASVFVNDDEPGLHQDYERWCRCAPQTTDHGSKRDARNHSRRARFGALGASLLRRVRWSQAQTRPCEADRRLRVRHKQRQHERIPVGE